MEIKELLYDLQRTKEYKKQVDLIEDYVMQRLTDQAITICTKECRHSQNCREEKTEKMHSDDFVDWRSIQRDNPEFYFTPKEIKEMTEGLGKKQVSKETSSKMPHLEIHEAFEPSLATILTSKKRVSSVANPLYPKSKAAMLAYLNRKKEKIW